MFKHIDTLFDFIVQTLSVSERKYLFSKLSLMADSDVKVENTEIEKNTVSNELDQFSNSYKEDFYTITKRSIKYSVIKKRVLVQKPKTKSKLINFINQIGQAEGGFSESTIDNIISELIKNNILGFDVAETVNWLK
jgi:hypothetical protein